VNKRLSGVISLLVIGGLTLGFGCGDRATPLAQTGQHANTLGERKPPLNYLLFLPQEYQEESQDQWPLILFLHGLGKRGSDLDNLEILKEVGPPMLVEQPNVQRITSGKST
jgi:hypothetical protein